MHEPVTADFVHGTADLTEAMERRISLLRAYLEDNEIERLWGEFVAAAEHEAGTRPTTFFTCRARQRNVDYEVLVNRSQIWFNGTDPDGDGHSYFIPVEFLFPETREEAKDAFREHLRSVAAAEREETKRHREASLERRRAEIARLEAEIAALDTSS